MNQDIYQDTELTYFKMNLLQAEIEMNAMKAENLRLKMIDESPKYNEKDFMNLIDKYGIYHNAFPFYKG